MRASVLFTIALAPALGCDGPNINEYEPRTGIITGTVLYRPAAVSNDPCTPAPAKGNVVITLFAADRLPPPTGTSGPVSFIVIPEAKIFDVGAPDASGLYAVPYTMPTVPAGRYQLRAFLDADSDFVPTVDLLAQPTAGDVGGGHVDPETGDFLEVEVQNDRETSQVTISLGRTIPVDRPAFAITSTTTFTLPFTTPRTLVLESHPIERPRLSLSPACTKFLITFVDDNGDGVTDDQNGDHLPDLYPRVVLRRVPSAEYPGTVLVPAILNPFPYLDTLERAGAAVVDTLELIVPPVAVERSATGDRFLPEIPAGQYETVVISGTGQTWQVPNGLDRIQPEGGPDPTQSVYVQMIEGGVRPTGSISGQVEVSDPADSEVYVFAFRAQDPPPPAGTGRPVALASLNRAAFTPVGTGRAGRYTLRGLPDGDYLIAALADKDSDFSPLVDLVAQPSKGDLLTSVPTAARVMGVPLDAVNLVIDRPLDFDRPAFKLGANTTFPAIGLPARIEVSSQGIPRIGISEGSLIPVALAGTDQEGDNLPDLLPRVLLTKMVDVGPAATAPDDPARIVIPGIIDPLPFLAAFGRGAPAVPTTSFSVILPPVALDFSQGGLRIAPPAGRYRVNLLSVTGQTWSVPNNLDVVLGRSGTLNADPTQSQVVELSPAPLPGGGIGGTVQLLSAPPAGDFQVVVLAFDRTRPPPPLGNGRPVANAIISKANFNAGTAEYLLRGLPTGRYEVRAFLDANDNFVPWFDTRNQPDAGDLGGGYLLLPQGTLQEVVVDALAGVTAGITVSIIDAAAYATDRPAYAMSPNQPILPSTGSVTVQLDALVATTDVLTTNGVFPIRWVDLDADGLADDRNGDGVRDLFPIVVAEKLADSGEGLDPAGVRMVGIINPAQFAPLGFPAGDPTQVNVTALASRIQVQFVPFAVTQAAPTTPIPAPIGRYRITLINPRGQTWTVPNELARATGSGLEVGQGGYLSVSP
jgi:uncharacterized protein (DUF3820 family)